MKWGFIMNGYIDSIDFKNLEPERYWSFPKNYKKNKVETAKYMVMSGEYLGSRKMDGIYGRFIKDEDGNCFLMTRNKGVNGSYANKILYLPQLKEFLWGIPKGSCFLGEIYFPDDEGSRKVTTICGCLLDKARERQVDKKLHYYIFDCYAYDNHSLLDTPFEERIKILNNIDDFPYIEKAKYFSGEELWNEYHKILKEGGEGVVITKRNAIVQPGKRTSMKTLKLKKELQETIDCYVTGNYKEPTMRYTGKAIETWQYWMSDKTFKKKIGDYYKDYLEKGDLIPITKDYYYGWAGSIELAVRKDNEDFVVCDVSGITEEIKKGIVNKPDKYYHRVCEVSAMEIERIDGNFSLRHPKFIGWRDDKDWQDCKYEDIISL